MMPSFESLVKLRRASLRFFRGWRKNACYFYDAIMHLDYLDRVPGNLQTGARLRNILQMFEYLKFRHPPAILNFS